MEKIKEFDLQIGNHEEAYWNEVIQDTKKHIKDLEKTLKFNRAILEMAEFKFKESGK